ncbi:hypothetical protein UVI_02005690 [Ustilaginoidea virens]|uniref:Uncharacterized protein n=1 Tax=Ustilaginoidea virens TaxID=1159556 RepID=A0A1B5KV25_USTVR|nr:hypothetical protein UVI_02005690 [Ustilaginoidea virens]
MFPAGLAMTAMTRRITTTGKTGPGSVCVSTAQAAAKTAAARGTEQWVGMVVLRQGPTWTNLPHHLFSES